MMSANLIDGDDCAMSTVHAGHVPTHRHSCRHYADRRHKAGTTANDATASCSGSQRGVREALH